MLHYKVFTSSAYNHDLAEMETAVNAWLAETRPLVHTMAQSHAGIVVVTSFLYELEEDDGEGRVRVATAEAPVEAGSRFDLTTAESVMITLLPRAELPY